MLALVLATLLVLVAAAVVFGLVAVGQQGHGRAYAPKTADRLARAARHLNGDAELPRRLAKLFH